MLTTGNDVLSLLKGDGKFIRFNSIIWWNQKLGVDGDWYTRKVKIIRNLIYSNHRNSLYSHVAWGSFAGIFPANGYAPLLYSTFSIVYMAPNSVLGKAKCSVCGYQGMPAQSHLLASGAGSQSGEDQSYENAYKSNEAYQSLDPRPINRVLSSLRHASLFTKISSIVAVGTLAVYFIIIGSGALLVDGRGWNGCLLLLLWCGGGILRMAYAHDERKPP